jgi:type IX secretion system PorP/SprF family membrane protein
MKNLLILLILPYTFMKAQDMQFYDVNHALLSLNPSFAGSNGLARVQLSYQGYWPQHVASFETVQAAADFYIRPLSAGLGFQCMVDNFADGYLLTDYYGLTYAQHLKFMQKDLVIIPSAQLFYIHKSLDLSAMHFGDVIDPRTGLFWNDASALPQPRSSAFKLDAGLLINYKRKFYAGAACFNAASTDEGLFGRNQPLPRLVIHGAYNFDFFENDNMQLMYRFEKQNTYHFSQVAANYTCMKNLLVGAGYASGQTVLVNAGLVWQSGTFTAGYNFSVSRLAARASGYWELHYSLNIRKKDDRSLPRNPEAL